MDKITYIDSRYQGAQESEYIRAIKKEMPILFGRNNAKYALTQAQVNALQNAAVDNCNMMELFFEAGFVAGRQFEKDHAE